MKSQKEIELELITKIKDSFPDMLDFNNCLKELKSFWKKEMFDIIEEELKIDEDMPILKKHIEQIRNRIKQKLKGEK